MDHLLILPFLILDIVENVYTAIFIYISHKYIITLVYKQSLKHAVHAGISYREPGYEIVCDMVHYSVYLF